MINLAIESRAKKIKDFVLPKTIKNFIISIMQEEMSKPLFLTGKTGNGKTSIARYLSAYLQCNNRELTKDKELGEFYEPCGKCDSCLSIFEGRGNRDTYEINCAVSNQKEDLDQLAEKFKKKPFQDKYSIYILDEFQLVKTGQDSILKPLEEPYKNLKIFIMTNEGFKVKSTIKGRCNIIKLPNPSIVEMAQHLSNLVDIYKLDVPKEKLAKICVNIALMSNESIRDSISNLETIIKSKAYEIEEIEEILSTISLTSIENFLMKLLNKDKSLFSDLEVYKTKIPFSELINKLLFYLNSLYKLEIDIKPTNNSFINTSLENNYNKIVDKNNIKELYLTIKKVLNISTMYNPLSSYTYFGFELIDYIKTNKVRRRVAG